MAQQRNPRPGRLVLIHAETKERLYAGPPATATWSEGRHLVEVAGKRYHVVPWSRTAGHDRPAEGGLVPTVTYRVLPEAPSGYRPGADALLTQGLGQSQLDTVRRYSQPGEDELQRAVALLEEG